MTNNQIIRNEAARLDPATLHAIATAHHTPDEIAAIAAACKTTDENGNEQPATVADVEIMLAADELHTFDHWKKEGKSVKKGEKHLVCCYLWKYTTKPSKEQREKAAAEGKEAAPDPHYYPTKSHLFSCLQVESSKPAPQARFKSTAEIIAYNKQLAAERKAAKEAAAKAAAEAARPAPIVVEEHHELPDLVHVEPLPTKPAPKKSRTTKKPAAVAVDMEELEPVFEKWYSNFYRTHDDNDSKEYREAVKTFDQKSKNDPEFSSIVQQFTNHRCDFISSDREAAAFVMALDELNHKRNAPEMVPSVQQLDFESIAANLLA
ncbi:MAG: hypothetical protein KHY36_12895 [Subdoligranulum variabile]|uniref:Uncharacterized protein n=1 Tax=Subdoligranulum variabile TaxID=214851 RepID=A0A943HK83_9FIRM|nr:hypothetical protein [Subdoligranulum variabile]